jgi:predicted dehydrogenase
MKKKQSRAIRYAVVGLGHFAQAAILPAFANAQKNSTLAALVTGDAEKAAKLGKKYDVSTHSYDEFDALMSSGNVDAVYIALPNSKHREYTERAARAGVHVLCEKPLAYTAVDAEAMIAACQESDVRLMTAYRLHFEEGNLEAIQTVHSGRIGEPRLFNSIHTMQVDPANIRVDRSLGGGPLEDIGIYCINAARYLFKAEPVEVTALAVQGREPRFQEVPEAVSATMRFPDDRLAAFICGFGESKISEYRVIGTGGMLCMDPAYTWQDAVVQTIVVDEREQSKTFEHRDQIAAEILYFAECIRNQKEPEPSGKEGLVDVRIIEALRTSYSEQRAVRLDLLPDVKRPNPHQAIKRAPHSEPALVNASPPSVER